MSRPPCLIVIIEMMVTIGIIVIRTVVITITVLAIILLGSTSQGSAPCMGSAYRRIRAFLNKMSLEPLILGLRMRGIVQICMAVSINRGTPKKTPNYYNPY